MLENQQGGTQTVKNKKSVAALVVRKSFPHSRDRVFQAWTDPDAIRNWFYPSDRWTIDEVTMDLRVGGTYQVKMTSDNGEKFVVEGIFQSVTPPERLIYTWKWPLEPELGETRVTVDFKERESRTELVLTHELFSTQKARDEHEWGWNGCLKYFEKYLSSSHEPKARS